MEYVRYSDIKWKHREHYIDFAVQAVNGQIVITATDTRDGVRYRVYECDPKAFIWD